MLVFTAFPEHASVASTLAAGACGLLVKDANVTAVRDVVRSVVRSGTYQLTHTATSVSPVTAREYDVLRLVASGHTNLEIGAELNLSVNTVKIYLREVMRKLGARNRAQVIMKARSSGLL
ncbi:response regulator transcription factor [Streptomyces sp. NPDC049687]|uniref:response regulator transcription factor n=1 Tax=Streptomyces sp. NPDC049687 TaxID=3365596 RepID=UPI00379A5227